MPKSIIRTYSRYSQTASALLGGLIRVARKNRKFTAQEVADRAGISRGLLQRIEKVIQNVKLARYSKSRP